MISFRNSMMILFKNSMMILFRNSIMSLLENSMMKLIEICITIIHNGIHMLLCIIWFMRKIQINSMMIKSDNSIVNKCTVALVFLCCNMQFS